MNRRMLTFVLSVAFVSVLVGGIVGTLGAYARAGGEVLSEDLKSNSSTLNSGPLAPTGSGFTYQGALNNGGNPANGLYDMTFALYDALASGNQVGTTITVTNQTVTNGLFTVSLDFGTSSGAFWGSARWLQVAVRPADVGSYITLLPRQPLTAAPYALSLMPGAVITATIPSTAALTLSNNGSGAYGLSATGDTRGVYGLSLATNGKGVYGEANFGSATGVYGISTSNSGYGVFGDNPNGNGVFGTGLRGVSGTGQTRGIDGYSATGVGVFGGSATGTGVYGESTGTNAIGVHGVANNTFGIGVFGSASAGHGVEGQSSSGDGVYGYASTGMGVVGVSGTFNGKGVYGTNSNGSDATGVYGHSSSGDGVYGTSSASSGIGVYGYASSTTGGTGVYGSSVAGRGVWGVSLDNNGEGVYGVASVGTSAAGVYGFSSSGIGVYGNGSAWAGYFAGDVNVTGSCCAAGEGTIKIDHPLDPQNKYLSQALVESPDLKTVYDGNITTNAKGDAVVILPDYVDALNRDFRYQLTVIGGFAQAIVSSEIKDHRFTIKTDKPNVKVSWQVTGIRKDPYARAHPIQVEETKKPDDEGKYRFPGAYGQPESLGVDYEQGRPSERASRRNGAADGGDKP